MNRYIVIDLKDNEIIDTNEIKFSDDENVIRFSGSVSCTDKENLINELEDIINDMKKEYIKEDTK